MSATVQLRQPNLSEETLEQKIARQRAVREAQTSLQQQAQQTAQNPQAEQQTPVTSNPTEQTTKEPEFGSRDYWKAQGKSSNSRISDLMRTVSSLPAVETPEYDSLDKNAPDQSNYNYNQNFIKQYLEKPLSEEELQRRERAAYMSDGVLNLGNAIGALGNLAFVAGGAAPQTLPTVPDTDAKVNAMRDRADRVRQQYINAMLSSRQADRNEYSQDRSFNLEMNKGNNALKQQKYADARGANQDALQKAGVELGAEQNRANQAQTGLAHLDQMDENAKSRAIQWANLRETQTQNQWTRDHADNQETTPIMLRGSDTNQPAVYGRLLNTGINDFNRKQIGNLIASPEDKADYETVEAQINKLLELDKATAAEMEKPNVQADFAMLAQYGNQRKQYRDAIAAYNNQINGIVVNACAKEGNTGLQRYLVESGLIVSKNGTLSWERNKPKSGGGNGTKGFSIGLSNPE